VRTAAVRRRRIIKLQNFDIAHILHIFRAMNDLCDTADEFTLIWADCCPLSEKITYSPGFNEWNPNFSIAPHIGHLYSAVIADAHCRYQRLRNPEKDVRLCTGTDEHGTKIQQAAALHGIPVAQYCDDISERYREVFRSASIQPEDFIRTTEERHKRAVAHFWVRLGF